MKTILKIIAFLLMIVLIAVGIVFASVYFSLGREHEEYIPLIEKYSQEMNMDEELLAAMVKVESGFNKDAKSNMGAIGLMQVLPETAKWVSEKKGVEYDEAKLTDPETNLMLGSYYFKYLFNMFKSEDLAILAYNGGMGNVNKWLDEGTITNDQKSYSKIPVYETKTYLERIKDNRDLYNIVWKSVLKDTESNQFQRTVSFLKQLIVNR